MLEGGEEERLYIVEKIIDKKIEGNHTRFLVKWDGYPIEESTWEPEENLESVPHLLDEFENNFKENPKPKKRGRPRKTENDDSESDSEFRRRKLRRLQKNTNQTILDKFLNYNPGTANLETDEVEEILCVKRNEKGILICQVTWKMRSDGITPEDSTVDSKFLKKKFHSKLIEYYESKIKFVHKKKHLNPSNSDSQNET
jgi:hypothetical protein